MFQSRMKLVQDFDVMLFRLFVYCWNAVIKFWIVEVTHTFLNDVIIVLHAHQASGNFLFACIVVQLLSLYNVIPCRASARGTPTVGTKIQGNVSIVEAPKPGLVIKPRLTALTKSAIPKIVHTTTAYFDQLYPFHKKIANGIAVNPMRRSPTPAGMAKAGSRSP